METYYMVQVEGKSAPTVKHYNQQDAKAEAERLCAKEQRPVDVLQCVATCCPPKRLRSTTDMVDALLDTDGENNVSDLELATRLLNLQNLVELGYDVVTPADDSFTEEDYQTDARLAQEFLEEAERYIVN